MIFGTSRAVRVYAYPAAVDLRNGYDGLFGLVKQGLGRDPLSGDLFLFVNGRRKGCKVLVWDGTGSRYLPAMANGQSATYSADQIRAGLQQAYADLGRSDLFSTIEHLIP